MIFWRPARRSTDESLSMKASEIGPPRGLRTVDAARYLGISPALVDALVRRGALRAHYIGRAKVFLREDLDGFLETRPTNQQRAAAPAEGADKPLGL